jgi:hypothetical protein
MNVETARPVENDHPDVRQVVESAIAEPVERLRTGLAKEGASLSIRVDEDGRAVHVTLVPERIVCTGCLLPEDLVRTTLTRALNADAEARSLRFAVKTHDWPI